LIVKKLELEFSWLGENSWKYIRMGAREVIQRALDRISPYRGRKGVIAASTVYLSAFRTAVST